MRRFTRMLGTATAYSAANTLRSVSELKEIVNSWTRPWTAGPLSEKELSQFFSKGFVIKENLLTKELVDGAICGVNEVVELLAQKLYRAGKITNLHQDAGFDTRLIKLDEDYKHANVLLHTMGVLPQGFSDLWGSEVMLDVAQQILGNEEDICGHPVWNLRCKTPEKVSEGQATVPWHQDASYLDESCWDKLQLTAWVPLVPATLENGCMQVLSGGHVDGIIARHTCCVGGTWYNELPEDEIENTLKLDLQKDLVSCELNPGSVLFLNNIIPQRSLPNYTNGIRWSLDLRWQRGNESNGFYGMKDSILMRPALFNEAKTGNFKIDWEEWNKNNRHEKQKELDGRIDDELDTVITGPWMKRWEIVNHNRHTAKLAI